MRIGVISDTHASELNDIASPIVEALKKVDLIVHAGDFTKISVLEGLRSVGPVKAVCGNMDSGNIKTILPQRELFVFGGKKIGLTHGSGAPWGITHRVRRLFDDVDDLDIIIYGHSHRANKEMIGKILLFNPGSARDSFGLLDINDCIKADIIKI
jgi:putative phosphoesterase